MHYKIQAVGKPALAYARDGIAEYSRRLKRHSRVEIDYLKDETRFAPPTPGIFRVVLDERGKLLDTPKFAAAITRWEDDPAIKTLTFQIGGSDGHPEDRRAGADYLLALGPLTLQHELALVVLLEQLYRAQMIKSGAPYHR